ncbi:protein-serine O-palmitoleoyltransferase por [Haematobia irritans]|uniref:protein-serine O-palmitoleoyltransferase por n=1 Tax=Haematobia irritans TaxID=7368 RepID=UPI003F4FE13D
MDYYYYDGPEHDLEQQADDYEYDSELIGEESFSDLCNGCIKETSLQIQQYIIILLSCGLVQVILWEVAKCLREIKALYHLLSIFCGLLSLWLYVGSPSTMYVVIHIVNICSFLRVIIVMNIKHKGLFSCVYTIACQLLCEILLGAEHFETIRGPLMLVTMKLISVAFDLQDGKESFHWLTLLGYLCSPSSLILGPWIPFRSYRERNDKHGSRKWNIVNIFLHVSLSLIFLNLSNCLVPWLKQLWNGGIWYRTYMDSLSIRCSHYFISYLSHATLLVNYCSQLQIVKPLQVEFPRSLSTAIRSWNIPMHIWLKNTVFNRLRSSHSNFFAIIITYLVSCLVHGFNYKVHLVLVSLGLFSYFENKLRFTLAQIFNACIEAYPCRSNCKYKHCTRKGINSKKQILLLYLVNMTFSVIAILQLAYLGIMLNSNNLTPFLDHLLVWSHMNFVGHWLASSMALFYLAI